MEFVIKIGAEAGAGVMVTGRIMAKCFTRGGYNVVGYPEYPSLVRGGHNVYQIVLSDKKINSPRKKTNLVVALNKDAIFYHKDFLAEKSAIIYDDTIDISNIEISPKTKVIAAEPSQADDAFQSFYQGKFIPSTNPNTIADGLLTSLGTLTFPIIKKYVNQIVTVSEESIIESMKLIWERMKIIIEPSAAVPLAALLERKFNQENKRIGIILSGGNVDLNKLPWNK